MKEAVRKLGMVFMNKFKDVKEEEVYDDSSVDLSSNRSNSASCRSKNNLTKNPSKSEASLSLRSSHQHTEKANLNRVNLESKTIMDEYSSTEILHRQNNEPNMEFKQSKR